jgi:hypothetical protein
VIGTLLVASLLAPLSVAATQEQDFAEPYRILRDANLKHDPALAASAYADGARLIFDYGDGRGEMFQGKGDIRFAYARTFSQVDPGTPIEIEFRFEQPRITSDRHSGAYRLTASVNGKPITSYGGFAVRLTKQDGSWRFAEDRGTIIPVAQFYALPPAEL